MKISLLSLVLVASFSCPTYAGLQFAGDLNDDQRVDLKDLRIFAWQWLDPVCLAPGCSANLNGVDGVNMADLALLAQNWHQGPKVVINEIHYDPDVKTELVEFVELHNSGTVDANISGWYFSEGISYQFPPSSILPAGGYIVVAQDPGAVQTKFGTSPNLIFGPFGGRLENDGEKIELRNAQGFSIDEVDYRRHFPWPIVGDPPGYSIELVNPALDNDLGGSWRPSEPEAIATPRTILPEGGTWSYFKGNSEASSPMEAWRQFDFNDLDWSTGRLPIGYGEDFIETDLTDMQGGYTSVYLRKKFDVINPGSINYLWLDTIYDDGWNAWINGKFVKGANVSEPNLPFDATAGPAREDLTWNQFLLPHPSGYLETENVLAIQLFNSSKSSSSDCFLDVRLVDRPASSSASPTPSQRNTTYSANIPPQMRQVKHSPKQPRSSDDVKISVKVTDPDGVKSVILSYQLVYPGSYIELTDPEYETNWTDYNLPMTDDGTGGDEEAGDDTYTVVIGDSLHSHRMLVRYRITATDNTGLSITGPYAHDPQPNFAYFVYDGVPGWSGAIDPDSADPVKKQVVYYSPSVLTRIPVYHLLSKKDSVEHATWIDKYGGDLYKWKGTLVYDDEVYDHIRYRMRGGVWRYAMGKNMWKFDFNRGHYFQAYDDYGKKYDTTWDKLNFSACIQQGDYLHRGEHGMIEAASFLPFNLMGVEAPKTHWVHYRIIDEAVEAGPTQYNGDFWGLYMVIEQMDGRFLDEHGLPDGNLYKIDGHNGELNNQGPNSVSDKSDINAFKSGYYYDPNPTEQWWRDNVNLESYYSYRAVVEGVHHGDIGYGKNYFFYLNPETNIWDMLPWDVDLCWANNMYGNGEDPFKSQGAIFSNSALYLEYHNRLREFHDLLYNSEQMDKLLDDLAAIIDPVSGPTIVDADRAMWDYNPIMTSGYVNSSKAGEGRFYQQAATKDFRGMVQIMKDYVKPGAYRAFDTYFEDSSMPYTPTVTATGPADYPINALTFETTAFSDPQGSGTFAAMKWRIAEVTDATSPAYDPTKRRKYEIQTVWDSGEITDFNSTIKIPASVVEVGHAYRVRVRMKDNTGRWSHWSNYIQFIAGAPTPALVLNDLRITELMYNPAPPAPSDPNNNDDFEFIELKNVGPNTIDLTYVSFVDGITFDFNDSSITSLDPCDFVLVVRNKSAFEARYGTGLSNIIAGEYKDNVQNSLENNGENIKLVDFWNGTIAEFKYKDDWYPITDGYGFSLTMIDTSDSTLYGPAEGLFAHWKFDDGSGVTAIDSAGINNGTLNGDPTWISGRINGALSFDGDEDYVSVSAIVPLIGNTFTVQAWIRTSEFAGIWNPVLIQNAGNNGYYFYVSSNRPTFYIVVGAAYVEAISPDTISAGQWYHVAGTNDGSNLKLYINGQLKDSSTSTGFLGINSNAHIGFEPVSTLYYNGQIDDVRIYNRALSESEFKDIVKPTGLLSRKSSWRASVYRNGSPGWDDSGILPNPGAIVINEVMAHSNAGPDWIELYNTTDETINIGGWFLSDNDRSEPNLMKYRIADGTTIASNDYLVFFQDANFSNPGDPGCFVPFGFSENGEKACLSSHLDPNGMLTGYREVENFGASQTNVSFGRYYKSSTNNFNFVAMDYNTPDANNAYPKVGPIVINEIMYNPPSDPNEEYIELHNITGTLVTLYRYDKSTPWKFTDGIDYTFSAGPVVTIQAYGYLMLVKDLSAFTTRYGGMPPGVQVLDDYNGSLNNGGEKLEISMPGDIDESLTRYYIRIDRVTYSDGLHPEDCPGGVDYWPREADGLGKSLSRKVPKDYGNDVANWEAATPSPGVANP